MIIYRLTDRVDLKIGDITFSIAPLSFTQKMKLTEAVKVMNGVEIESKTRASFLAIKYCVKDVKGINTVDGEEYKLELDEQGYVTDNCVEELFNIEITSKLVIACFSMIQGVPETIINPETGEPLEGVELVKKKKESLGK